MSSALPAFPAPTDPLAVTKPACDRCGSFYTEQAVAFGKQALCAACGDLLKAKLLSTRVWSSRYVWGVGILLNGATAAVLVALNWRRLGNAHRERTSWIHAGIASAALMAVILSPVPQAVGWLTSIFITWFVTRSYGEEWQEHAKLQGPTANRLLPIVFTVAVLAVVLVALAAIATVFEIEWLLEE